MLGEQTMDICLLGESILAIVRGIQGAQIQKHATTVPKLFLMMELVRYRVAWTKDPAITIRSQPATIRVACPTTL
jgi:hypothetical protein